MEIKIEPITLREIISKDSNNIDAFLLLGDIVRDKDVNQAIKIHQSIILRPRFQKIKKLRHTQHWQKIFYKVVINQS